MCLLLVMSLKAILPMLSFPNWLKTVTELAYLAAVVVADPTTGLLECSNPLVYVAMAHRNDPDNPRYHEAMASIDHESFKAAMVTEIVALPHIKGNLDLKDTSISSG